MKAFLCLNVAVGKRSFSKRRVPGAFQRPDAGLWKVPPTRRRGSLWRKWRMLKMANVECRMANEEAKAEGEGQSQGRPDPTESDRIRPLREMANDEWRVAKEEGRRSKGLGLKGKGWSGSEGELESIKPDQTKSNR